MNSYEPSVSEGPCGYRDVFSFSSKFGRRTLPDGTFLAPISEVNEIPYWYAHTSEIAEVLTMWLCRCKVTVHTLFNATLYIVMGIFAMSANWSSMMRSFSGTRHSFIWYIVMMSCFSMGMSSYDEDMLEQFQVQQQLDDLDFNHQFNVEWDWMEANIGLIRPPPHRDRHMWMHRATNTPRGNTPFAQIALQPMR